MPKQEALASEISEDLSEPSEQDNDSEESVEERFIPKVDRNLNYEPDFNHVTMNVACKSSEIKSPTIRLSKK